LIDAEKTAENGEKEMRKKILCVFLIVFVLLGALASCECKHEYSNGVCEKCQEPCPHSYEKGICAICGAKDLQKADLADRTFEFSYFELSWTEGTTDQQKEVLRKRYNAADDKELFDKLHEQYNSILAFAGAFAGSFLIDTYEFCQNGEYNYVSLKSDTSSNVSAYEIEKGSVISIGERDFYYEKNLIYTLEESEDYDGITIKEVFLEKQAK